LDFNSETPGADASQTNDYLKDVDKGAETLLSTREFVYYSFYARIRRQLNQHWGGKVREKLTKIFREGRTIASTDDKITKVLITLNRRGDLVRVQVLNDSGIRDLDEAAVEAFKEAAPFPNPPDGIVEPDGTIKIRWDFILEA
jgi:TonB family protein